MIERLESGLSAEVRQLIATARGADDPSAEDEARVKARWLASIAAGAGISSLTEAAHAAAGTGWGLKVAGVAVAVAAASAGLYLGWPATSGNPSARSVAARSVAAQEIRDIPAHVTEPHA
ncbi:MAG TPA: hypothetical protein VG963_11365, partial [Polyangiaceae bacterium]|nr:hypothetical protein [Polyangiaceae bacterium]